MNSDYKFRMSQDDLKFVYETALSRMVAHPSIAKKEWRLINDFPFFKSEKEALAKAFELMQNKRANCQIWAKVEKSGDVFRVAHWWVVTDDWKIQKAADYIGMAQMYDTPRLRRLLAENAAIDDIVAYW